MLSDKLYRLVPQDAVLPDFLLLGIAGARTQGHLSMLKTGLAESQTNISQAIVRALWFALPPLPEQRTIVSICSSLQESISMELRQLGKLRQIKLGLMDDLLTGRVRVT